MNRNDYIFIFSLFETVVVMTCADKFLYYNNFFKQFTVWNMYTQLRYPYEWTTALNSFNIFIIFHMFFILEPELRTIIPQKCNLTINQFHVANIIMHIIPALCGIYTVYHKCLTINYIDNIDSLNNINNVPYKLYIYLITWYVSIGMNYKIYSINNKSATILLTLLLTLNYIWKPLIKKMIVVDYIKT